MKHAPLNLLFLLFILLAGTACKPASTAVTSRNPGDIVSVTGCPEVAPRTHQLIAAAQGICLLYPETYNAVLGVDGTIMLYVRSLLNNHVPIAFVGYTPSNGQTLEALAAQRLADYAWPDTKPESIMLGGEAAVMLDNLPGQDTNRRVVAVHDDRVYDLVIHGIGANYGVAGELAEELYDTVIASLQFIDIEPDSPLLAGPECPFAGENLWYTNEPYGYCLMLPPAYSALSVDPDGAEIAFYVDSVQDTSHARLSIKVADANGRSLEEITMDREAEIEKEAPGTDMMWSWGSLLDGEPAYEFRQVPGPELSRQVLMLHNGRLYTFTFVPDEPMNDKTYAELQDMYELVMDSFSFLWQI